MTSSELNEIRLGELGRMHAEFARQHPEWENRIEVIYVSASALRSFGSGATRVAIISGDEPLDFREAGRDWLIDWYVVREQGVALMGPSPNELIPAITTSDFVQAVRDHMQEWRQFIREPHFATSRKRQSNAVLAVSRALFAAQNGKQVSKQEATRWIGEMFPEWAQITRDALDWRADRRSYDVDHEANYPDVLRFVDWAIDRSEEPSSVESGRRPRR